MYNARAKSVDRFPDWSPYVYSNMKISFTRKQFMSVHVGSYLVISTNLVIIWTFKILILSFGEIIHPILFWEFDDFCHDTPKPADIVDVSQIGLNGD